MSQANGARASWLVANPLRIADDDDANGLVRPERNHNGRSVTFARKITTAPAIVATKVTSLEPGDSVHEEPFASPAPPRIAGRTMPAWFAAVPYQGTRPRSSRSSVVPIKRHPSRGDRPPSAIAAMTGAIETLTNVPRGIRTGRAPANSVISGPEGQTR